MKYKLLVSDYDGTLVYNAGTMSDYTREKIAEFKRAGGLFTICSGRMTHGIISNIDKGLVNAPLVSYQGAQIYDTSTNKVVRNCVISNDIAVKICQQIEADGLLVNLYEDDHILGATDDEFHRWYARINNVFVKVVGLQSKYILESKLPVLKILAKCDASNVETYFHKCKNLFGDVTEVCMSGFDFVEFNNPLASKGEGVRALASILDIPLSQVVCVGDNENDISMLKVAGLAVAVDNATDFAKNASTYITTSVLDDGVGKLIDYLLKE